MPSTATITLSSVGTTPGTFSLYSNVDNFTTPFETGISQANMLSGYVTTLIPDGTTVIRVQKQGCPTYLDLELPCYSCDNCVSPFEVLFGAVQSSKNANPSLTYAQIFDTILDVGIVSPTGNLCCPDCGNYTFGSVETWLKYAEAVGLTQSAAVPA